MSFFIKTPHWGLFLLLIVLPIIGWPLTIFGLFLGITSILAVIYLLFIFMPLALFICWLYSAGQYLYDRVESTVTQEMGDKLFRFNFYYTLLYLALIYILAFVTFNSDVVSTPLFLPLNLFAIFCLFYGFYFVSRNLAIVEGKGSNFGDYIGYFFLVWFFPIGVWIIQPKINRLYRET